MEWSLSGFPFGSTSIFVDSLNWQCMCVYVCAWFESVSLEWIWWKYKTKRLRNCKHAYILSYCFVSFLFFSGSITVKTDSHIWVISPFIRLVCISHLEWLVWIGCVSCVVLSPFCAIWTKHESKPECNECNELTAADHSLLDGDDCGLSTSIMLARTIRTCLHWQTNQHECCHWLSIPNKKKCLHHHTSFNLSHSD